MRTLSLLRHAKSSWGDERLPDFERPLAKRGREAAPRMGACMRQIGLKPDIVICSPARRTRETLELVLPTAGLADVPVTFDRRIYEAEAATLLQRLAEVPTAVGHVLMIGHNPGLQELALLLAGGALESEHAAIAEKLPTGALVVIELSVDDWTSIAQGSGHITRFVTPRSLP